MTTACAGGGAALADVAACAAVRGPVERAQRLADLEPGEKKMEIDQSATEEGSSSV